MKKIGIVTGASGGIGTALRKTKIICEIGVPNILVNNAGIGGPFHKIDQVTDHQKKITEKTPLARIAKPQEVASLVVYLTEEESSFINGSILTVDGGLTCHAGVT